MIRISNLTVSTTAPVGATIGALTLMKPGVVILPGNFTLTKGAAGFFGISGSNLVTEGSAIPVGFYSVRVRGVATTVWYDDDTYFTITVTS
jgi:hypothetical protein